MFNVYVLKSLRTGKRYIGYTSKDPQIRLSEHNKHCNEWDKGNSPFILVYFESFQSKKEAMQREAFLKSGQGRKLLKTLIADKITNNSVDVPL
jgi:putative endonuclease